MFFITGNHVLDQEKKKKKHPATTTTRTANDKKCAVLCQKCARKTEKKNTFNSPATTIEAPKVPKVATQSMKNRFEQRFQMSWPTTSTTWRKLIHEQQPTTLRHLFDFPEFRVVSQTLILDVKRRWIIGLLPVKISHDVIYASMKSCCRLSAQTMRAGNWAAGGDAEWQCYCVPLDHWHASPLSASLHSSSHLPPLIAIVPWLTWFGWNYQLSAAGQKWKIKQKHWWMPINGRRRHPATTSKVHDATRKLHIFTYYILYTWFV